MDKSNRILVVDNENEVLELAEEFLGTDEGLTVKTVSSGDKALEIIEDDSFDAIVSDYRMPEMDGLELLKRIREKGIGTLFYLLTGEGNEKTSYKALNWGANGYFTKNSNPKKSFGKLKDILVKSIEKKQSRSKHLIAWITVRMGWGKEKGEKFKQALKDLGETVGFKISEIETKEVSKDKEIIQAYTDNYHTIPLAKVVLAKEWKEIVTDEHEVVNAGFKYNKNKYKKLNKYKRESPEKIYTD
ncbi:hypothetical protein AKJ52_01390 [candidate division MSBL1 archaeon SCGC-AAA382C18]|uniref:Response regulatory domain-containing protein n=1 Tax=candidate division MSBL1 archaeon SCGC-AAA382C18 TaxID=1698281 RepID=A0A133VKB4_9EURY|nr:hypothetical protein AKJ52_01390 [candidate division MSBL1 archaeon SCGC-AAA382C18]